MKKLFLILLSALMLTSRCGAALTEQSEPDFMSGTPWPLIDVAGVVTADTPTDLKDNFALAVNKELLLSMEIPAGYAIAGTLHNESYKVPEDIRQLFYGKEPDSHDGKLAYDLFWLMMDWDSRDSLGVSPLKEMTDQADAVTTLEQLDAYLTEIPEERRLNKPWKMETTPDPDDSTRIILSVGTPSLLMSDSAEYSDTTPYGELQRDAKSTLARKLLVKLGYSEEEAGQKFENCLVFETMMAQGICTDAVTKSAQYKALSNNRLTREELLEAEGTVPILETKEKADGFPEAETYLLKEPDFLKKLNELWTEENVPLIRDFIIVTGSIHWAQALDRECYEWDMECNNTISGISGMKPDDVVFSDRVSKMLMWPVARLYSDTYLKEEDKARISAMVDEIKEAYHGILNSADWLSAETRAKAIEKLDAIGKRVLYPDDWTPYSCEELHFASAKEGGSFFDASIKIAEYNRLDSIRELSEPADKSQWVVPPQMFNCCYNHIDNSVYILGSFARGGIYNSGMSDVELYARLGAVIGHEISHAFDSSGAQYDKDGNLKNWWTDKDRQAFLAKNEKLSAFYSAIHPWKGQEYQGVTKTGEACADLAGIKVILQIAATKPDFNYDTFFRSYAGLWAAQITPEALYSLLVNVHPLYYLRVNAVLQHFDEFLDCYGIQEGDGMYLAPEDRVNIW